MSENCPISNQPCSNAKSIQCPIVSVFGTEIVDICQNCCGVSSSLLGGFPPCHMCGITLAEFQLTKKFGCQLCVFNFSSFADSMIQNAQGSKVHVGKTPKCLRNLTNLQLKIIMRKAIDEENYEKALECKELINHQAKPQNL